MFKWKKKKPKSRLELTFKHIRDTLKLLILSTACCAIAILVTSKLIHTIFTESLLVNKPYMTILRLTMLCVIIAMLVVNIIKSYRYLKFTYEISMTDLAILLNERKRRLSYVEKFGTIIPKDDSKKTVH
jgi:membrane protein YdbS with pleckstrin-like domain